MQIPDATRVVERKRGFQRGRRINVSVDGHRPGECPQKDGTRRRHGQTRGGSDRHAPGERRVGHVDGIELAVGKEGTEIKGGAGATEEGQNSVHYAELFRGGVGCFGGTDKAGPIDPKEARSEEC
mmetsp:Transcript_6374/g.9712  ORF Transcript_6374/g.9712 Transcript_6374/m.9712 type:complete len:125 (-) Transcript_6374:187-561(-)